VWKVRCHGVRWSDIRDRIFDGIDPIAAGGGSTAPATKPDTAMSRCYQGSPASPVRRRWEVRRERGRSRRSRRTGCAGRRQPAVVPDIRACPNRYQPATTSRACRTTAPTGILGSGFIAAEFAHVSRRSDPRSPWWHVGACCGPRTGTVSARLRKTGQARWGGGTSGWTEKTVAWNGSRLLGCTWKGRMAPLRGRGRVLSPSAPPKRDLLDVAATGVAVEPSGYVLDRTSSEPNGPGSTRWAMESKYQLKHVANHEAGSSGTTWRTGRAAGGRYGSCHTRCSAPPQLASVGGTRSRRSSVAWFVTAEQGCRHSIRWRWRPHRFREGDRSPARAKMLGAAHHRPQASDRDPAADQAMSFGGTRGVEAQASTGSTPRWPDLVENACSACLWDE